MCTGSPGEFICAMQADHAGERGQQGVVHSFLKRSQYPASVLLLRALNPDASIEMAPWEELCTSNAEPP